MRNKIRKTAILSFFLLLIVHLQPLARVQGFPGEVPEGLGRYIVLMQLGGKAAQRQAGLQKAVEASGGRVQNVYNAVFNGFSAELPPAALAQLRSDPDVALIEPDSIVTINDGWLAPSLELASGAQSDPVWGLDRIDQRELPLDQIFTYDTTAVDVHVYVVDTGLRVTHEEFAGRVGDGFTAIDDGGGTSDCNGHGTHVAGTIGGSVYGVAKGVTLHPVRVMGCYGSGYLSDVIDGLEWVLTNGQTPGVVNMSLGGVADAFMDLAVSRVIEAGFTVVAAAGNNDGGDACQYSPAGVPEVITVGATDSTDTRPSFSNIGECLDVFAPGASITSAYHTGDSEYQVMSGTSMAAPHVAGAVALYLQNYPGAGTQTVSQFIRDSATVDQVKDPGSGSPNRLLFINSGPIPLQPSGLVIQELNTFEWSRVDGASEYELELYEGAAVEALSTNQYKDDVCAHTKCSVSPDFLQDLQAGEYRWRVRAYQEEQWGEWTVWAEFAIAFENLIFFPILITN